MMSAEKAKRKAQALEKYMDEERTRRGGGLNTAVAVVAGGGALVFSYKFLGVRSIPFHAALMLGGYIGGQNLGAYIVGDANFRETYTMEEYHLLKEQLLSH